MIFIGIYVNLLVFSLLYFCRGGDKGKEYRLLGYIIIGDINILVIF